ncbi:STAS domain-containing protein [Maritimibacter sp. HL-12]|jgi:chemotaxis protein CheX|uniref:STAS domain-containing protein n=1 Tax=Maritimibacter sp. HL-12 TaxID=1162418 RepID=UPI000A0EF2BC|nr:STAS domain-containing protein [Maritimibacter sp. HL-12]SMH56927.1 chemotaxis protein CheX [Maritimibacter sp. HL-12]
MSAAVMVLEPRLDLRATGPLVEALIARRGEDLALDAGAVTQIGALSVQALRAAARSWAEDGHALSLENASSDLADQLGLLGFTPETLTIWEAGR